MASLPPEIAETLVTLERPAARDDWTIGRASTAITELRALVARWRDPVRVAAARGTPAAAPPWLVVVQRRESVLAEQLRALARPDVPVIWDRRDRDRRAIAGPVLLDRRRRDRRRPPPATWSTLRFLVVRPTDPIL